MTPETQRWLGTVLVVSMAYFVFWAFARFDQERAPSPHSGRLKDEAEEAIEQWRRQEQIDRLVEKACGGEK